MTVQRVGDGEPPLASVVLVLPPKVEGVEQEQQRQNEGQDQGDPATVCEGFTWMFICGGIAGPIVYGIFSALLGFSEMRPYGRHLLRLAKWSSTPFGRDFVIVRSGVSFAEMLASVMWFISLGLVLASWHLCCGIVLVFSIIFIPWGKQHFRLIPLALFPFQASLAGDEILGDHGRSSDPLQHQHQQQHN
ncbi:Uncharacterized protein SCF082_LOCUS13244, partial [Durusdinium trenchii]